MTITQLSLKVFLKLYEECKRLWRWLRNIRLQLPGDDAEKLQVDDAAARP